jgi:hypothetical protein
MIDRALDHEGSIPDKLPDTIQLVRRGLIDGFRVVCRPLGSNPICHTQTLGRRQNWSKGRIGGDTSAITERWFSKARVSALGILYTVVRETYLVGKEIFPGSEDAK